VLVLTRTILELEPSGDFGMSLFLAGTMLDIFGDLGFSFCMACAVLETENAFQYVSSFVSIHNASPKCEK